ncbi:hypothetical protein Ngar_c06020 [Candidatus Nitrososphaera gargensis Ga9.2]|uniref:Uncharacterized protein n=1 Tax=Nitrososphaera gargensis (strain Ga9.2) TaxID=1237085 RepID=K0ID05_NITGG|nr:hypothetical protein [Candidatus Nitrososphaera gargensis]AFU57545.1 hypothetical protein Ngar_c06020 [Candidatus Nitrososphaera gargensis Ga9.2]
MKTRDRNDDKINNDVTASPFPTSSEPELEAIVGETYVADFQSHRLKTALSDKVAGYMHLGSGYYRRNKKSSSSTGVFSHRGKLYRISISVREI